MLTGTPPAKHGVLHRSIDIELRTDPHVHNSVPAAWACLDSFGSALRAETTSPIYSDASPTLPACRFSAPSVAERSRPSAIAPARSACRYRCSTAAFCLPPSLNVLGQPALRTVMD